VAVIWFRPLVVDYLSVTAKLGSSAALKNASDNLWGLLKSAKDVYPGGKIIRRPNCVGMHIHLYPEKTREIAEFQAAMTESGHKYFRLVLHPSKFKGSDFPYLQQVLAHWVKPFSYASLFHHGRVTRIDFAADDLVHPAHSFLPFKSFANVSSIFVDSLGYKGALYLGSVTSESEFSIYDKARKLKQEGHQLQFSTQTRIEARLRQLGIHPSEILAKVKNPFLRLEIADLQKLYSSSVSQDWQDFITNCKCDGSARALASLPNKYVRQQYMKRLRQSPVSWWQPAKVWNGFESAIEKLEPSTSH
jgi:hypothetical protein